MPCPDCVKLETRVSKMEKFCRSVATSFDQEAVKAAKPAASAVVTSEPPEDITGPSRIGAWRAGWRAADAGMPSSACPYRSDSRGHDNAWRRGHSDWTKQSSRPRRIS